LNNESKFLFLVHYSNVMANKAPVVLPRIQRILTQLGENIRLARLRRRLSAEQVAERAGIARSTLAKIEQGQAGVGVGHYINVLKVFRLEEDFLQLAADDEFGRKLQDAGLQVKKRAPKRTPKS
jgi:DNA-binding XRE family transcriptional regulator